MDVLYKYVSAERALTCLPKVGDGTLRATQPSALNDPFECSALKVFVEERVRHDRVLAEVLTDLNRMTPIDEDEVKNARERWGTLFWQELIRQQVSRRFGIISFASDPFHPLLWAHYTHDGSGFAIGYDTATLGDLTRCEERLAPVQYLPEPPRIRGYEVLPYEDNIFKMLLMKSEHWKYEEEWRIVVELNHTIGMGIEDRRGQPINLWRIPNEAVRVIYHTERTPDDIVRDINSRMRDPNNRYGVSSMTKLVLSETSYSYEEHGNARGPANDVA